MREVRDEVSVDIDPAHLRLVHAVHHHQGDGAPPDRIGFFFEVTRRTGEPVNREPDRCLRLAWFATHDLPRDLISYPAVDLRGYPADTGAPHLSLHGW